MNPTGKSSRSPLTGVLALLFLATLVAAPALLSVNWTNPTDPESGELTQQVHALCAACHAFPPPDSFPRSSWQKEVLQGYQFAEEFRPDLHRPAPERVIDYFMARAPEALDTPTPATSFHPPVGFRRIGDGLGPHQPAVSNVNLVRLFDPKRPEILACDMRANVVKLLRPYQSEPKWEVLANVPHPVHTEVVDLDGDGIKDIVVACLGAFLPTDQRCGKVVWLRGNASGGFTPITLLENVGRVADVRAADFNGDGKLDLVVAVFGWRRTGSILLLENQTTDWAKPKFVPRVLDERHGAIHVPVADLNNDGKPDFVALISQEHETVVAFLNEGGGTFRKEVIFTASHPAFGSSGIELVDMDGDGKLDVLYTAGDSLDNNLIRPEHGVYLLENHGTFPFVARKLATLFGAHRAVAADFDGDGDLDIVAVSLLPSKVFPRQKDLDAIILLEQVAPGQFERHTLKRGGCNHATVVAGDLFGEGRIDFVTGNFTLFENVDDSITIWRNQGRRRDK
jgi:VCBS repeat protein